MSKIGLLPAEQACGPCPPSRGLLTGQQTCPQRCPGRQGSGDSSNPILGFHAPEGREPCPRSGCCLQTGHVGLVNLAENGKLVPRRTLPGPPAGPSLPALACCPGVLAGLVNDLDCAPAAAMPPWRAWATIAKKIRVTSKRSEPRQCPHSLSLRLCHRTVHMRRRGLSLIPARGLGPGPAPEGQAEARRAVPAVGRGRHVIAGGGSPSRGRHRRRNRALSVAQRRPAPLQHPG